MSVDLTKALCDVGATPADIAWFESFGWRDDRVPPPDTAEVGDFRRREALLNRTIADLGVTERGESQAGHLAAAIGARLADHEEDEDEDDA